MRVSEVSLHFADRVLFDDVSITFNPGQRYGLVGANGAGKTSFLKILAGQLPASHGDIELAGGETVGFLQQDQFLYDNETLFNVVLAGNPKLKAAIDRKHAILEHPNPTDDELASIGELESVIAAENGYLAEATISKLLSGLGIASQHHHQAMHLLSGGYKLRVLLAQLLFKAPNVLLLDEPTNHLDITTIAWLEQYLIQEYEGVLIFISHDRSFLDNLATEILDVDYGTILRYPGNYQQFEVQKAESYELQVKTRQNQDKKVEHLQSYVDRFRAKASKAKQAQSRLKQIEKMSLTEVQETSRQAPNFQFKVAEKPGKVVLTVEGIGKSFKEKQVLNQVSFEIKRGEKVGIVGANGLGKSTLIKILLEKIKADNGAFTWGSNTSTAYVAQDHHEDIHGKVSVLDWLYENAEKASSQQVRNILGNVLFTKDDVNKNVLSISGGEATRLLLARMMLTQANCLFLDEPTNHLDMESCAALADALIASDATVFVVSHDRYFIDRFAQKLLILTPEGVTLYTGNYSNYLLDNPDTVFSGGGMQAPSAMPTQQATKQPGKEITREQQKAIRSLQGKISKCENEIEQLEKQIAELEHELADSDLYQAAQAKNLQQVQAKFDQAQSQLQQKMEQWQNWHDEVEKRIGN